MNRTLFLLAAFGLVSNVAIAAPNDARSGVPTDTGTSVDKLMEEKVPLRQNEAVPPSDEKDKDKNKPKKVIVHGEKHAVEAPAVAAPETPANQ